MPNAEFSSDHGLVMLDHKGWLLVIACRGSRIETIATVLILIDYRGTIDSAQG